MQTIFSTDDVHPRDRFDYWHRIACKTIVEHDCRPECRTNFNATLQGGSLGDLGLLLFENSPMEVSKNRAAADELFVCRQMAGRLAVEQSGREAVLDAGDMTLLDPLLPYTAKFFPGSKLLVLKLPRRLAGNTARQDAADDRLPHPTRCLRNRSGVYLSGDAAVPCGQIGRCRRGDDRGAGARSNRDRTGKSHAFRETAGFIRSITGSVEYPRRDRSPPCRSSSRHKNSGRSGRR